MLVFKPKEVEEIQDPEKCKIALKYRSEGLFEAAANVYEECLHETPDCIPARLNLGVCYMKLGRFTEATRIYKDSGAYVTDPRLGYNLSLCLVMTYSFEEAKTVLQNIAKTDLNRDVEVVLRYLTTKIGGYRGKDLSEFTEVTVEDEGSETRSWSQRPRSGMPTHKDTSYSTADRSEGDVPYAGMWRIFKTVEQYSAQAIPSVQLRKPLLGHKATRAKSARAKIERVHPKTSFITAPKISRPSDTPVFTRPTISPPPQQGEEISSPMPLRVHHTGPMTQESLEANAALKTTQISRRQEDSLHAKLVETKNIIEKEAQKLAENRPLLPDVDPTPLLKGRLSAEALAIVRAEMQKPAENRDYPRLIDLLSPLKFFAKFQKEVRTQILKSCSHRVIPSNEYVYRQQDPGDIMYIILAGSVVVQKQSSEYGEDPISIHTVYDGETFGEVSLFASDPSSDARVASIITLEPTDVFGLGKTEYRRLMLGHIESDIDAKLRFFSSLPLFENAQKFSLIPLVSNVEPTIYTFGQVIVQAGAVPKGMHLIYAGLCKVYAEGFALRPRTTGKFGRPGHRFVQKFSTGNSQFSAKIKPPKEAKDPKIGNFEAVKRSFRETNLDEALRDHYLTQERTPLSTLQPGDFFSSRCLTDSLSIEPSKFTVVAESAEVKVYVLTQIHLGFLGEKLEVRGSQKQVKTVALKTGEIDCPANVSREEIDVEFERWNKYKRDLMEKVRRQRFSEKNKDQIISALREI